MNAYDILTKVDEEILADESQWTQGAYENRQGQHCLVGALDVCTYDRGNAEAWLLLRTVVGERFGYRNSLTKFNDNHSFAEVKAVIKEARQRACV